MALFSLRVSGPEAVVDGLHHHVAYVLTAERLGRGNEAGHLPVAAIEHEGDVNALAAPAPNLKTVRAPAQVWLERNDDAVVLSTSSVAGAAFEQELVPPHDSIDALRIHALGQLAIQQRGHAAIPVARTLSDELPDARQ